MALTRINKTVTDVTNISTALVIDTTTGGIRHYVDSLGAGKSDTSHNHDALYVKLAGSSMTGRLTLMSSAPTTDWHAAPKQYVDSQITAATSTLLTLSTADTRYLKLTGGTVTGAVSVPTPTANAHAATKQYVDNVVGGVNSFQSYVAGTTTKLVDTGALSDIVQSPTKVAEFVMPVGGTITIRVGVQSGSEGSGATSYIQVYKNGNIVGIKRSHTGVFYNNGFPTWDEDFQLLPEIQFKYICRRPRLATQLTGEHGFSPGEL